MELKLERQTLSQVHAQMKTCRTELENLKHWLDGSSFPDEIWLGDGKTAYLDAEKQLRTSVGDCRTRLENSAAVLWNALQTYKREDNAVQTAAQQLRADEIF